MHQQYCNFFSNAGLGSSLYVSEQSIGAEGSTNWGPQGWEKALPVAVRIT